MQSAGNSLVGIQKVNVVAFQSSASFHPAALLFLSDVSCSFFLGFQSSSLPLLAALFLLGFKSSPSSYLAASLLLAAAFHGCSFCFFGTRIRVARAVFPRGTHSRRALIILEKVTDLRV